MTTETIRLVVDAIPVAQPRQRHAMNGRNYIPSSHPIHDFKASVRKAAAEVYGGEPIEGPLEIGIVCVLPRPKGKMWKTKPMPREPHCTRGDCDNFAKGVLDALNGRVFRDDAQVCRLIVEKWIAAGDEQPHVTVEIARLASDT